MIKKLSIFLFALTFIGQISAFQMPKNISPQQIEQFKKLPPAQQKRLAKSMGVDLSSLQGSAVNTPNSNANIAIQEMYPRGTIFDAQGNVISEEAFEVSSSEQVKSFGYDVFANAPQTFSPQTELSIPDDYILGVGDSLNIQFYGKENASYESSISREGYISLPKLGNFKVSGLSFLEAKSVLRSEIQRKVLGVEVATTLTNLRSIRVFVLGEAFKPGPYVLSSLSSITHAIFAAGGFSDIGSLRNIKLKRAGKLISTFDAYDLLIHGDSSKDLTLKSGDVIFVEPIGNTITITGEVRRPAIYEISKGESFKDVVALSGGILPSAYLNSTLVERFNKDNLRTILTFDLSNPENLIKKVYAGDNIKVLKTSDSYEHSVTLIGAVARPGKYQWKENYRISDLVPSIHTHLLDDADLTYGLVIREKDQARNIEVLQFNMFDIAADTNSSDNFHLQPQDKVLFFTHQENKVVLEHDLNSLAYTEDELLEREKERAKNAFDERKFWLKFGSEEQIKTHDDSEASALAVQSIEQLTGAKAKEEVDVRQLSLFSRKRLLQPVIEKLRQQAAAGQPMELVEVVGSVKYPGVYPLAKKAKTKHLVAAAGGLLESAFLVKAELTRNSLTSEGAQKESLSINLNDELSSQSELYLQSKDRLNILQVPSWQDNHIVELRGEFMFPGKYTIRRGETLEQLIERVGGYTEYAYLDASVFTRVKLKQMEMQNLLKVSESLRMEIASKSLAQDKGSNIDYSQAKLLLADLTKVKPVGRLVVDLKDKTTENDVLLENGDILYVPTKQNSINVIGQVQVATSHLFRSGITAEQYISLSGGVKQQADEERIYVIKANGSVEIPSKGNWFTSNESLQMQPGDTVVVPLDSDYMDNLTLWATGTQIVYQAAVAIAAISGI